jgi:L-threonylcarbamoyladenylate synthase
MVTVDDADLARAVHSLRRGRLVAFPTETVYGLGADASNADALKRLFKVKRRPTDHPVIVHLADAGALDAWAAEVTPECRKLADSWWPGPLTLVVARGTDVLDEVTGGRRTIGLRVPDQPVARALLRAFDGGIAAPSANRFGRVSPTTADHVRADLGDDVEIVLDGGPCAVGLESTIVDCSGSRPTILRLGALSQERVEDVLDAPVAVGGETAAPGTLPAHYAPRARVLVTAVGEIEQVAAPYLLAGKRIGLLAMAPTPGVPAAVVVLDPPADVDEYARMLFARLRDADALGLDAVLAVPPPRAGIGAAIVDRLVRASRRSA